MTGIDRDILITRVLDGEATPEDWAAFRAIASRDADVWAELADAQQDRADLAAAMADAIAIADQVEAPVEMHAGERLNARIRTGAAWMGWVAAAAIGIGALVGYPGTPIGALGPSGGSQTAGFAVNTPEEAMQYYFDKGREQGVVLGELPERVLLDSSPASDGDGYVVVSIRQIVERHRVPLLYQLGVTEVGEPAAVPYRPERRPGEAF